MIPDWLAGYVGKVYRIGRNGLLGLIGVFVGFIIWWLFTLFNNLCEPEFAECTAGSGQLTVAAIGLWIVALSIGWFWVLPTARAVARRVMDRG